MDIELLGTTMLKHFLMPSRILRSNIPERDKGITWDGYIDVYNRTMSAPDENPRKEALLAQVPVQVKGHVEKTAEGVQTFDLELADLRNYQTKDGTIFFQGRADEKGGNERIFYKALLPGDAAELLRTARGKQSRRVALDPLPTELALAETLLTEFARAMLDESKPKGEKRWADYAPAELKPLPTPEAIPDPAWDNPYLYSAETVEFRGREDEMQRLRAFLNAPGPFLWWAYVAPGGTGKTRLAWELRKALEAEGVWAVRTDREAWLREYGALSPEALSQRLRRPTLLILDYAQQYAGELGRWLAGLTARALDFYQPLRLLLLERADKDPEDRYPWERELYQNANEYRLRQRRYAEVRELPALEDAATLGVIRDFAAALRARERDLPELAAGEEKEILQRLKDTPHTDRRPLFAMLVTDAWLRGDRDPARSWEDLVEGPVERERRLLEDRLRKELGDSLLAQDAAFELRRLATLLGASGDPEWEKLAALCPDSVERLKKDAEAAGLPPEELLRRLGLLDGAGARVRALRPDLFGEFWLLQWMKRHAKQPAALTKLYAAGLTDFDSTKLFLQRCLTDYPALVGEGDSFRPWFLPVDLNLTDDQKQLYVRMMRDLFEDARNSADRNRLAARMEAWAGTMDGGDQSAAVAYSDVGSVYQNLGKYSKAAEYKEKDLAITFKIQGPEHPDTATSYNNLAVVYWAMGDYQKALEYQQKALAIWEKILGPEHPDTARSYNNLAELYRAMGEYQKALEYHQRALAIRERVLGPEHPDTARSYNNLASVYWAMGEYPRALEYHQRALVIRERVLDPEHPDTARSYNNLASVYKAIGDYPKALEYYQRALGIWERVLGPEHPDTARSYNNLASVYDDMGDYPKALEYHQKALAIREKILGPEHPDTALSCSNIGVLYLNWQKPMEALPWLRRALAVFATVLGPEHPYTKNTREAAEYAERLLANL